MGSWMENYVCWLDETVKSCLDRPAELVGKGFCKIWIVEDSIVARGTTFAKFFKQSLLSFSRTCLLYLSLDFIRPYLVLVGATIQTNPLQITWQ